MGGVDAEIMRTRNIVFTSIEISNLQVAIAICSVRSRWACEGRDLTRWMLFQSMLCRVVRE